ncbi:MAG: bL21 family ribosomal protein, partial [Pirellulaceae bacterium]
MIAIVKVAGQQFKVEKDQTLYVPRVEGAAGDKLDLEVLLVDADGKLSVGSAATAKVKAEIVDQVKG